MKVIKPLRERIRFTTLILLVMATIVLSACANVRPSHVSYKGANYILCGGGERSILKECGLPEDITEDLAGAFISYLEPGRNQSFQLTETDTGTKMFEYGPEPNENVYIVFIDRHYYAAILNDSEGYHGLRK